MTTELMGFRMADYIATIKITRVVQIRVSNESSAAVRRQLEQYGLVEAVSDYPCVDEAVTACIGVVAKL